MHHYLVLTTETLVKLLAFVNCCYCLNISLRLEMIIQTDWYAGSTQRERGGISDDFNQLLFR